MLASTHQQHFVLKDATHIFFVLVPFAHAYARFLLLAPDACPCPYHTCMLSTLCNAHAHFIGTCPLYMLYMITMCPHEKPCKCSYLVPHHTPKQ